MPVDIRLTYDDLCLLPNNGKRYEIVGGELLVTPAPRTPHQKVVTRLTRYLSGFAEDNSLGTVFVAPFDVVFSGFDVVEPDVLYISKERLGILTESNAQGAPDLVVEVLSESTAEIDRTTKLKLYARYGVEEYWIIDPDNCSAEIYRRTPAGLDLAQNLKRGDVLTSPLLPGFNLSLARLVE